MIWVSGSKYQDMRLEQWRECEIEPRSGDMLLTEGK